MQYLWMLIIAVNVVTFALGIIRLVEEERMLKTIVFMIFEVWAIIYFTIELLQG